MIGSNQNQVAEKKIHNKVGGLTNESRFGGIERELRQHKVVIAPSVNTDSMVKFEQGWNRLAQKKDVVRISIGDVYTICERSYLEQALATCAQGDEILKFTAPTVG